MDKLYISETHKKYARTSTNIKVGEALVSIYVEGVVTDDNGVATVVGHKISVKGTTKANYLLKDVTFLPMPDNTVFDYLGRTFVFKRVPNRQFRKGLCSDNSLIEDVMSNLVLSLRNDNRVKHQEGRIRMSHDVAHKILQATHAKSLNQALLDITTEGLMSRSLSNTYWIGVFPKENTYIFYRYEIPLAYYSDGVFTLINKVYQQEVLDFCSRSNLACEVK